MKSRSITKCRGVFSHHLMDIVQLSLLTIAASIFAGCHSPSGSVVNDPNGNFHLYISNQSFAVSPVDIKVSIDGNAVVNGSFEVGSQHNFREFILKLTPGQHTIVAESSKGHAQLEQAFEVNDQSWAALAYWFYPKLTGGASPCPRHFSLDVKEKPIYFF